MLSVYFDQNPFDDLRTAGVPPERLAKAMGETGYQLIVSESNVQEWAGCWKSGRPEKEKIGRELVRYALDLKPERFFVHIRELVRREAQARLRSVAVNPFLSNPSSARELLERFAAGKPTTEDFEKMLSQWRKKEAEVVEARELLKTGIPDGLKPVGETLDQCLGANPGAEKQVARALLSKALAEANVTDNVEKITRYVLRRLDRCPALRTAARTHLYVNYRIVTGRRMRHDTFDDLRHCIHSSYADVLVTGDEELREACGQIHPGARVLTLSEFMSRLGLTVDGSRR